ncbi:uncharacterized protein LOC134707134 isoform X2 [Mytilus trossulus]|uniref:uncharacterized protein LOC134707134 isoform X2 n=1 Tax=Mytilus trossulus TaxID=6551 RepID=UPI003005BF21
MSYKNGLKRKKKISLQLQSVEGIIDTEKNGNKYLRRKSDMNIPRSVLALFLVFICFKITLTRHVRGTDKTNDQIDLLRNLLLEDEIKECDKGFSYNVLTEECENDDDKSNRSGKPAKPIDPVNVLRKLLLGDRGQIQCSKEGFSYNRLTGKCEDDDERFNSLEKHGCCTSGAGG